MMESRSRLNILVDSSPLSKYSKEKQKVSALLSYSPHAMPASFDLEISPPTKANSARQPPASSQTSPLCSSSHENSFSASEKPFSASEKPFSALASPHWNTSERFIVSDYESCAASGVKDGKNEAPPPIVSKNTIMQSIEVYLPTHNMAMQGRSAVFLHEFPFRDDYNYLAPKALPAVDFLEACYLCKRKLSHHFDIYIYRGDQAFCSEECRYKQIVSDERKEKSSLSAIKMRTSVSPIQSAQQNRRVASGAAAG